MINTNTNKIMARIDDQNGKKTDEGKPSLLVCLVRKMIAKTYPPMKIPPFQFKNTRCAARHNCKILANHNWDMHKVLNAFPDTCLQAGSEFRPIEDLEPLFKYHVDFQKLKTICTEGAKYSFKHDLIYSDDTRRSDLLAAIKKGNNKSAQNQEDNSTLQAHYAKEVKHGWMIPFLKEDVTKIIGAGVIPIGFATQMTIDANGQRIQKRRTTHDLSRPMKSGESFNSMVDDDLLDPCLFGFCLLRYLHHIHEMRSRHPVTCIFLSKIDLDAAFRRLHIWIWHALLSFTIIENIAYMLSRMPFGAKDGPGKHETPSNIAVDLAQLLMDDKTWDPEKVTSPAALGIPTHVTLPPNIPFGEAHKLIANVEQKDCYVDGYIDDLCTACLDVGDNMQRGTNAVALALHTLYRPRNEDEPICRNAIMSVRKLAAEGRLEEIKVVLGWTIDTRRFLISLPPDKATRWIADFKDITNKIETRLWISTKEWQSIHGKCNTASYIYREGRFFTSRIKYQITNSIRQQGRSKGGQKELEDCNLWITIFEILRDKGRSINHTTITFPHLLSKQDASEQALGGFTCFGIAWRLILPKEIRKLFHINILEFLAVLITTWLTIEYLRIEDGKGMKILAQTDNTSALGWLKGSTRFDKQNMVSTTLREKIGRKLARLLMEANLSLYSQHVPGIQNDIADHLSRNIEMSNSQHLHVINSKWKQQAPADLQIITLPPMIFSWIQSVLETGIQLMELPKEEKTTLKRALRNGFNSQQNAKLTPSCAQALSPTKLTSSVASRTVSDITSLATQLGMNLEDSQFAAKSSTYQRPSNRMVIQTQFDSERV